MKKKIESGVIMLCGLLLGSSIAFAGDKVTGLGFLETGPEVPEVDFHGLGSVGIGTLLMVLGYTARKGYSKLTGRKK